MAMKMQTIALVSMITTAVGGVAWVLLHPLLSGERQAEQRRASMTRAEPIARATGRTPQKSRREQVEETLKGLDLRSRKPRNPPLSTRIVQAGLSWSKRQFLMIAAGLGLFAFALVYLPGLGIVPASAAAFTAACGVPLWLLSFLKKRREKQFPTTSPTRSTSLCAASRPAYPCTTA